MGNDYNPDLTKAHSNQGQLLPCLQRCELQSETLLLSSAIYPAKEVFFMRKDYCYILRKLAKICNNTNQRSIFESEQNKVSCNLIVKMNSSTDYCGSTNLPNITRVLENKNLSNFILEYAERNLVVLKIFIQDPFYTRYQSNKTFPMIVTKFKCKN
jgi:hypothetical protein